MDDTKKDLIIPELVQDGHQTSSRFTVVLTVVGVGLAFVLAIAVVVGGLYISKRTVIIQNDIDEDDIKHNSQIPNNTENEEITIRGNIEVYLQRDAAGGIKSVAVLDLDKDIYGEYIANTDECYIATKENSRILNITMAIPHHTELNERNPHINTDSPMDYETSLRTPESDYSTLPEAIADLCKDKQLYWIQPTTDKANSEPRASRIKRQLGINWCIVKRCTEWKFVKIDLGNGEYLEQKTRKCTDDCVPCPNPRTMLCSLDTSSDNPTSATSMTTTTATSLTSTTTTSPATSTGTHPSSPPSATPSPFYSGDYSASFSGWGDYSSSSGWDFSSSYYSDWGDYSSSYSGSGDYSYMSYK